MSSILRFATVVLVVVALTSVSVWGEPIQPNLAGLDFNFSFSSIAYDAGTQTLTAAGAHAVTTFEPVLGGTTHAVFNLDDNPGGAFALAALFDHQGTEFDVDGHFTSPGLSLPDLVVTGKIPALGLDGSSGGVLVEADVIVLQMYGAAGSGAFAFNGYFRVTGGDLVTEGYINENDVIAMASWLTTVSPSLVEDFDFSADFSSTMHLGELGSIPEPATMSLVALAGGAAVVLRRRRR